MTALLIAAGVFSGLQVSGDDADWSVSQSGLPGLFSWQNLYNWTSPGVNLTPPSAPNLTLQQANLNLINIRGDQTINLDGLVTLGTLNIGDTSGQNSYVIAAGTGGSLAFSGGGAAALNKTGTGTDVISSNITLTDTTTITVSDGILALTGVISGSGTGIIKEGDGMLILRGSNTYTGANILNGGTTFLVPTVNDGAVLGSTAGSTTVNNGATLAFGPDALGSGGIGNPAEPVTINGRGFRNNGALRFFMGVNSMTFNGPVTMGSAAQIQADVVGTLTLSGAINVNQDLRVGGAGFVSLTGAVSGSNPIMHYGVNGFRMQNTGAGQTFNGSITSELGEVRADSLVVATGVNPYANVSTFTIRNGYLQLVATSTAAAVQNLVDDDIPISLSAGRIRLENNSFNNTTATQNAVNWAEVLGDVTIAGGNNLIDFRDTLNSTVVRSLTFNSLTRAGGGTTFQLGGDGSAATTIGTGTQYRVFNSALNGGGNVPFVGGWAYYNTEFMKYNDAALGGNGYTSLAAGDYAIDQAVGTWAAGQNIKISTTSPVVAAGATTIQSLNMQNGTGRTLTGAAGATLVVDSGGIITSGGTHTIAVPFLTAGAGSNYELYDIAWSTNIISSVIADNAGNAVSLVKAGGGTTSLFGANTYTGTTYINEGMLRDVIGANHVGLGSGNLTFGGSPTNQGVYETDRDFTRALGTGAGQVQLIGGVGAGFSAFGAPININFGGAGATVAWGSSTFNPGIFTLNGGNATHVATLVNNLDLGGEQRYIRLDGSASGTNRAVIGAISGDISNGSIVKRGGGILVFDNAKSYENGTIIHEGELWLTGAGTAGANVAGNDIQINSGALLKIESPGNIGSRQAIILQNGDVNTPAVITFGSGYGTGSEIVFSSFTSTGGIPRTGGNNILIANNQSGQARRIAVTISGNFDFQNDVLGQIRAVAPNVEAWFGADSGNGTFTGATLSPSGGAVTAFRLGGHTNNGGVLTIANANVLTGAFPLIVGAPDQNDRNYTDGTIYIPQAQNYSGQVTIGQGGILQVGTDGALSTGNNTILLRGAELRVDVADGTYGGQTDTQYASRILDVQGANSNFRTTALSGGGFNKVTLDSINFPETGSDRALFVGTLGTIFTDLQVNTVVMPNAARNVFLDVGNDNSFQTGIGILTVNGVIADQATGVQTLQKRNGGVLILNADNTYDGNTLVQQGRLVLSDVGAAGSAASSLQFNTNSDRRSDIEFRLDGTGPFTIANASVTTGTGGNDGSTRVITVGPVTSGNENAEVILPNLTISHAGAYTVNGGSSSALYFDGANGYRTTVSGAVALNRSIVIRTRGALTTFNGIMSGAATNLFEKSEQGTLVLNGNNTYLGTTTISNGYLIAGNDNAFGAATSDITFRNNVFSQILASGSRTISRNFINTATGSTQTLGGLDAGAKLFSGNVNLSTAGISLTSIIGGDTTFTGTISGGFAVTKQGNGAVILNPASGTGNTFTGGFTVQGGTLQGNAQTIGGSPFGNNGAITVTDGTLKLEGLVAPISNSTTATTGNLTVNGGNASVVVSDAAADTFDTRLLFGGLTRTGNSTLILKGQRTDLGTAGEEKVSLTAAPALTNGTIGTWAVIQGAGSSHAANYAGMSGSDVVAAPYGGAGDLDSSSGSTVLFDATGTGGTLTANRSVFAFRTDTAVALGGFTLNVGAANSATLGQAGFILNNGADITGTAGSLLNFGTNVLNVYADDAGVSTIGIPLTNVRNNIDNTLSNAFTKFGPGTLELGARATFEGGITVNQGTLSLTAANVIPTFGNLNAVTGSIVTIRPGATVLLNGNNQEFGNLAGNNQGSEFQFSGGVLNLGTATLTVGREGSSQTFSGQLIGGAGSSMIKIGTGTLTVNNYNGNMPNSLGTLYVDQGAVATRNNDQSWATPTAFASSIPSSTDVYLRGGTWQVRTVGDSTTNNQRISIGNNIIAGGGDSVLSTVRDQGGAGNKLLTFGNLTLGVQRFLTNNDNTIIPRFDGVTTLTNYARIQTDNNLVLAGVITGNYSLEKRGGSDLSIGADNSTWNGGMVINDGILLFGSRGTDDIRYQGVQFVPSSTANVGTGDIVLGRSSAIRLNTPSNILSAQGQRVQVFGIERINSARIELGQDRPLADYNVFTTGNVSFGLNLNEGLWSSTIDESRIGNGHGGISAVSNTYYTAATLGAGSDNVYRFGGSNAATLSITQSGALFGSASVEVGSAHYLAGSNPGLTEAAVRFYGDQTYTGPTTIFREADAGSIGATLELTGNSASPVFNVYGRLTLRGDGRVTNDAGAQVNTVNLFPGGNLRLDYSMDVADSFSISRLNESNLGFAADQNKWADNQALVLDGAGLNLINSSGRVNEETVGDITVKGGAGITLERNGTNGQMVLTTSNIIRSGQSTLSIRPTSATAELGSLNLQSVMLFVTGAAPAVTNGMAAPWMVNATGRNFLSYGADTGFTNAPFVIGTPTLGGGDAFLSTFTGTEIVQFSGGWGDTTLTGTRNVYALRVDEESGTNDMVFTGGQINIRSGGLIAGSDDSNRVNFDTTNIYFGDGTAAVEGIVYGGHSSTVTRFGGVVTAANLTFDGPGQFQLTNTANAITGTIQMNGGTLYLDGNGTRGTADEIILHSDYANNFNGGEMPSLRLRHNSATTTYAGLTVTVAGNVPYAQIQAERFSGTSTTSEVQFGALNVVGTSGPAGTMLLLSNSNSNAQVLGTTTFGGTSPIGVNVNGSTWRLNGAITGSAPIYKTGDGVLRFDGANDATFSSPVFLNRGEIRLTGIASGGVATSDGTGPYTLNFGTLRLASANTGANTTSTFFNSPNQNLTIAGAVTIGYDRNGGTPGSNSNNVTIGAAGLEFRTVNSPYIIFDAFSSFGDGLRIASEVVVRDQPFFRITDHNLFINNIIRGNGTITRSEAYLITFNNNAANPDWSGGFTALQGYNRVTQANTNFTFGTGPVNIGPTAVLSLNSLNNIAGSAVNNFSSGASTPVLLGVSQAALVSSGNLNILFPYVHNTSRPGMGGILGLDSVTTATPINLATFQDGYWSLGANIGSATYTGDAGSLTAGAGNVYRLGGGGTSITIDPLTPGSTLFTGAGAQVQIGRPDAWQSAGYNAVMAAFNNDLNSDYTGGTTISRGRDIGGGWYQAGLLVNGGNPTASTFRTPLGSGQVDVYGHLRFASANGGLVNSLGDNYTSIVMHTGSRITFDNRTAFVNAAGEGRYDNEASLTLNGSHLQIRGTNNVNTATTNREDIGELIIQRGSQIRLDREGTGFAGLGISALTRGINGTLTINHNAGLLGANTAAGGVNNTEVVWVSGGGSIPMTNNMVDPWIVSRNADQFLKYDSTNGLQVLTQGGNPSNYLNPVAATITLDGTVVPLNDGTEILDLGLASAAQTLGANLDVHALRLARDINVSADGLSNRITVESGGIIFLGNSPTINADLKFGATGTGEALIYTAQSTGQINGQIQAGQVTKFGRGFLNVRSDQPQFTGNWVVNEGGIQFLTPGAVGSSTSQVILNGTTMSDDDDRQDGGASFINTELRYNFNSGSPDEFVWNHGKVTAYDNNFIYGVLATDRNQLMPDIDLRTTATAAGGLQGGLIRFQVDSLRSTLRTGAVTLFDNYMVYVNAGSFGPGSTVGVKFGAINNGGLYDLTKTGDGVLTLIDSSATFTGNRFTYVDEGAVRVLHNGAFGAAGNTAVINQGGALEIAVAAWSPLATLDQRPGSIERWAIDGARSGTVNLPSGVHLQIMQNQTGTQVINLNGGSIMGYEPLDWDQVAIIHTLGSGVTVNLLTDSFLGQPYPAGGTTALYDMGKLNTTTNLNPSDTGLRGSYLQIDGSITGTGGITKIGQDLILLNGANSYDGATTIKDGTLQIGRANGLPIGTSLVMNGSAGQFDLNGNDQEVASLSGPAGSINNGGLNYSTLTVNQTAATTYGGTLDGNVTLLKRGSGTLTLAPTSPTGYTTVGNSYRGGTVIEEGTISVSQDSSLGFVPLNTRPDALRFNGGALENTATMTIPVTRGITLDSGGSLFFVDNGTILSIDSAITGPGSLTKAYSGTMQLNNATNDYTGNTNVTYGTLQPGGTDVLAPRSRHFIVGELSYSGTLNLNGFDQTIGSLSSAGSAQASAVVALGANTLTVGNDTTRDAVYSGTITGTGTMRVNGDGAEQTFSAADNSGSTWQTDVVNGQLNVAGNGRLGSGSVTLGVTGFSGVDDRTALDLRGVTGFANNITVNNVNTTGSAFITASSSADSSITGTVTLNRDVFSGAAAGQNLGLQNTVSGSGRLTVVDGGTLRLATANTYGAGVTGTSGPAIDGGTIVRAGTLLLENSSAAGSKHIELGDVTSSIGAAVDRATFTSVLGTGTWNPNGDGVSATSGGQNAAGTTGFGAFIGVSSTVDGNTYGGGDVGKRILVAGEEANPERNGIYTIVSVTGGTMNLVRADDFENSNQMKYGGQVAVANGSYASQTMFMYEENVVVRNEPGLDPIRFRADIANPDVAALVNVAGLNVANDIDINATNGSGSVTVGGSSSLTSGTSSFSGTLQLANVLAVTPESRTVRLSSGTTTGNGIVFSGLISEADPTAGSGDMLSVNKVDAGTVTLSAANTYRGTTTVSAGRLQVGDGTSGSILGSGGTAGAVTVTGAATSLSTAPILAGGSPTTVIAGATTIGTVGNPGILAPGLTDSSTSNHQLIFSNSLGVTVASGSQIQMSVTTPTLTAGNATVAAWLGSGNDLNTYLMANPGAATAVNVAPANYGDHDYINIINGGLTLGGRASGSLGDGSFVVQSNGWASPAAGDLFNLLDWAVTMSGTFSVPGTTTTGGVYGDIDLPMLSGGLTWDVSAFTNYGILAVSGVPEPGRALLIMCGLLALGFRRSRRG